MSRTIIDTFNNTLKLYNRFEEIRSETQKNAPYHFNALFNASPLEPGVSNILAGFFHQKTNGEYLVLKSFINRFFGENLMSIISNPEILAEKTVKEEKRIDILVYEKDKYAIVFENKIWDAEDQPHQLANYIEALMEGDYCFREDQIYIAYLPKTKDHVPSCNSWMSQEQESYKKMFESRFRIIDFKEDIISWLQESPEVQNICDDDYFVNSRFLFIDFLRRAFKIDTIDDLAQNEMERIITEQLGFVDNLLTNTDILTDRLREIGEVVNRLTIMRKELTDKAMKEWLDRLQANYHDNIIDRRNQQNMSVGLCIPYNNIQSFFEVFIWNNANYLCVVIGLTQQGNVYRKEIEPIIKAYVHKKVGYKRGKEWLYYKETSYENAYPLLQELIRELKMI